MTLVVCFFGMLTMVSSKFCSSTCEAYDAVGWTFDDMPRICNIIFVLPEEDLLGPPDLLAFGSEVVGRLFTYALPFIYIPVVLPKLRNSSWSCSVPSNGLKAVLFFRDCNLLMLVCGTLCPPIELNLLLEV